MVSLSEYELRLIARNRGTKNYNNMTKEEELLSTHDETKRNLNALSGNGLRGIAKIQNLSHNELNQIIKIYDQSQDELEHVVRMRRIKNRKRMSKEELITTLLKSKYGIAELFNNSIDDDKISDI